MSKRTFAALKIGTPAWSSYPRDRKLRQWGDFRVTVALMGDSTAAQGTTLSSTSASYNNRGISYWMLKQTDYRINAPIENNIAASGSYIDQARTLQLPNLDGLASRPTDLFLFTGTNDLAGGNALAVMQSEYAALLVALMGKAYLKRIWCVPITPRTTGMDATLYQRRKDFNAWLADLVITPATATAAGLTAGDVTRLRVLDVGFATQGDGDTPIAGYVVADGLHHTAVMAQGIAVQASTIFNSIVPASAPRRTTSSDVYNATTNPKGTILNHSGLNRGMLLGTAGTKTTATSLTPTGNVADRWRIQRTSGTSTATLVGSKGGLDANGFDSQSLTYTITSAGTNSEVIQLEYLGAAFGVAAADGVVVGAPIWFEGQFEIVSNSNDIVRAVAPRIASQGMSPNFTASDGLSSETTIKLPSGALGPYWFRTPLLTPTTGVTFINPSVNITIDATGGTGSCEVKFNYLIVHQPYV